MLSSKDHAARAGRRTEYVVETTSCEWSVSAVNISSQHCICEGVSSEGVRGGGSEELRW